MLCVAVIYSYKDIALLIIDVRENKKLAYPNELRTYSSGHARKTGWGHYG
jgi:hypothetical protein